jgi:hypothetical protein
VKRTERKSSEGVRILQHWVGVSITAVRAQGFALDVALAFDYS